MYRICVVSAVFNVERYLDDFLNALDQQTIDHSKVQVILVDDGSTDGSLDRIQRWADSTDYAATVSTKPNGGQSSARNMGLDYVNAEWVSFTDPDDFLAPDHLREVDNFLRKHDVCMAAASLWNFWEESGERDNDHPLAFRFDEGNRVVDIDRFPQFFQLSASSAYFRADIISRWDLRFDERVRPVFEDGHFIQRYLLNNDLRRVGFIASAKYFYRRRADHSSTLQASVWDSRRYGDVLEYGYLNALQIARGKFEDIPRWLQNAIIYDLAWLFRGEGNLFGPTAAMSIAAIERFHDVVAKIREHLEASVIEDFDTSPLPLVQRDALLHGYSANSWHSKSVTLGHYDSDTKLVELRYHYVGELPEEEIRIGRELVLPGYQKTRVFPFLRKDLVKERILWVPISGSLEIALNGKSMPLSFKAPVVPKYTLLPSQLKERRLRRRLSAPPTKVSRWKQPPRQLMAKVLRRLIAVFARRPMYRRVFVHGWLLMDRDYTAGDNAEHLFRYLRENRRDINAWFTVRKGTADYRRLKKAFGKRIVAYGSIRWRIASANASYLLSSHADRYVYDPHIKNLQVATNAKFVFLQHGVIQNDLSRWLNGKPIFGFVTSTDAEYASLAGNESPYELTPKQVWKTGMPRFDRLERLNNSKDSKPAYITIMPTWRHYLMGEQTQGTACWRADSAFFESDFVQQWLALMQSSKLRTVSEREGLRIRFMPHPNLAPYLSGLELPTHIEVVTYDSADVQKILVDSAVVVTDYSSTAFDAAFIRRPVVYFQFDADEFFGGRHSVRPGYFSYERDGFGPVTTTLEEALQAVNEAVEWGPEPRPEYAKRIDETFTLPPDGACERVVAKVEELTAPPKSMEPFETPDAPPIQYRN